MKKTAALLLLLFMATLSYGQGNLKGKVELPGGQAAEGVTILTHPATTQTITDKDGRYQLKNLPNGKYEVHFQLLGMQGKSIAITINNNTIDLEPIRLIENVSRLDEVTVNGQKNPYSTPLPSAGLRLKTPTLELPQNVQTITRDALSDQATIDMLEGVTRNVSGATMIEHWGTFARINMRGFKIPAFRNGMNVEMPWGPLTEDMSFVERIEFVKGPSGFMMAAGEPGGFYNVVTKKPMIGQKNEVTMMAGSFNTLRTTADLNGKLTQDGRLLYRLNIMGSTKESHRAYEWANRYTIAPSISYAVSDNTTLTAEYNYSKVKQSIVGSAYVFSPDGFATLDRDFTMIENGLDPTTIEEQSVFINANHKINNHWEVTAQLGYFNYDVVGSSFWPWSVAANGDVIRGVNIWDALNISKLAQVYTQGQFNTGAVSHKVLGGLDMSYKTYYADWNQSFALDTAAWNIYNPTYGNYVQPTFDRSRSLRERGAGNNQGQGVTSWYVQDELGFFQNTLRLTLAGRYTATNQWAYGNGVKDEAFTPRVGVSYSITPTFTVYGLYDQSFLPQIGKDFEGNDFDPVRANDLEGGVKKSWFGGKWTSAVSVYQITKDNVLTADPNNQNFSIQLGQVQSKGVEFDLQGEILPGLNLILNYANTDVRVTEDTDEDKIGDRVAGHAKHMTNGWLNYRFNNSILKGFGISLGYQYQIDRSSWAWSDNTSVLPDYFRLDGALSWKNDDFSINLNVNNLLNDYLYSGSAYATYVYWQAEPGTNFRLSLAYKF